MFSIFQHWGNSVLKAIILRFLDLKQTKTPPSRDPLKLIDFGDFLLTSRKTLMENANELVIQLVEVAILIEAMPVQIYRFLLTSMGTLKTKRSINIDLKIMRRSADQLV